MQETSLILLLSTLCAVICLACVWLTTNEVAKVATLRRRVQEAIDGQLELHDRIEVCMTGIKRIEGRVIKQVQRQPKVDPDGEPDSKVDPEAWKLWKNRQLATGNRGRMQ